MARRMWASLEPIHAMIYFVPEAFEAWKNIGFTHPRMGYFASRSAAMGAVEASVVAATFFNFNPETVARFIPEAWSIASPDHIIATRYTAADEALHRLLGDAIHSEEMSWAADAAMEAAAACPAGGRSLFAGHAAVPVPDVPHLRLWHATTLLREFRGDGHVHALISAGLTGLEAVVSYTATGDLFDADFFRRSRGWNDDDWASGVEALQGKGWIDDQGALTDHGRAVRETVEDETDRLSLAPWQALGEETAGRLATAVRPWRRTILDADVLGGGGRNVRAFTEAD